MNAGPHARNTGSPYNKMKCAQKISKFLKDKKSLNIGMVLPQSMPNSL